MAERVPGKPPPKLKIDPSETQGLEDWLHSLKAPPASARWANPSGEEYDIAHNNFGVGELHDAFFPGAAGLHPPTEETRVPSHLFPEGNFDEEGEHVQDLSDVIEQAYGMEPWSGLQNNRPLIPTRVSGSGPLINMPLSRLPGGSKINVPLTRPGGGLPGGSLLPMPGGGFGGGSLLPSPGFKPGQISLQDLLRLRAQTMAQAHGHPIARQRVA